MTNDDWEAVRARKLGKETKCALPIENGGGNNSECAS